MAKRKLVLILLLFFSAGGLMRMTPFQSCILASDSGRSEKMSEEKRKREIAKMQARRKLEWERRRKESKKKIEEDRRQWELGREQRKLDREKRRKESLEKLARIKKEFLFEKYALRATEEQWKVIKAKLEKVRYFRDKARSTPRMGLTSSSGSGTNPKGHKSRSTPAWQWGEPWEDKDSSELTAAQKLAKQLIALVENKNTSPEQFRRMMDALRKARREEDQIKKQLSEAQQELREVLTTRQEAALVLQKWL